MDTDNIPKFSSPNKDGLELIKFLLRHKKLLLYAMIISVIASLAVTFLMKPLYESSSIIFPTPTNSPDKILAEPQFGYEVDADWLMQVLKSEIVRDSLNKAFNLVEYFDLDSDKQGWMDDLRKEYEDMISFERTRYMSIEITAKTRDPELSANIVNFVIDHIDGIREKIFKANTYQALIHYENTFFDKNDYVNKLIDSLYSLRENNTSASLNLLYNQIKNKQKEVNKWRNELDNIRNQYKFYDLETRMENINAKLNDARSMYTGETGKYEVYLKSYSGTDTLVINTMARIEGASRNIKEFESEIAKFDTIKKKYEDLSEKIQSGLTQLRKLNEQYENTVNAFEPFTNSIKLERLSNDYAHQQVILNELRYQYETTLYKYLNPVPSVYVINRAEPSYEKVSPKLWKNGLIIILSTMTLIIGLLLLFEQYKSIRSALDEPTD